MRVFTKAELIRAVPERWKDQYTEYPPHMREPYYREFLYPINRVKQWTGPEWKQTYEQLLALPELTDESIAEVIGSESWTRLECGVCKQDVDRIVMFPCGEYTLYVCPDCLSNALEALKDETD